MTELFLGFPKWCSSQIGCRDEFQKLEAKYGQTLTDEADRICANVYSQAKAIAHAGFPSGKHDIFMEQGKKLFISERYYSSWLRYYRRIFKNSNREIPDDVDPTLIRSNYYIKFPDALWVFLFAVGLCGILGYANFFQSEWLDAILSWQQPNGCYGYTAEKKETTKGPLSARWTTVPATLTLRVKREDRRMEGK